MCAWPLRLKICKKIFCRKGRPAHLKALLMNSGRYPETLYSKNDRKLTYFLKNITKLSRNNTKLDGTHADSDNLTIHRKFAPDILNLAKVSEELLALCRSQKSALAENLTPPKIFTKRPDIFYFENR